jgi:succinoglycan biosynthesis protein ExoA
LTVSERMTQDRAESNVRNAAPVASAIDERTRVLVVVPTLNEETQIEAVLRSLLSEARRSSSLAMQIAVVDGGSTDRTREIVERLSCQHPGLEFLHNRARIQSAAVNLAVRRFGHLADVLIRCDAHTIYPEAYCTRLVRTLLRTEAHSVVVPMDSVGDAGVQRAVAWLSNSPLGTGGSAHRAGRKSGFVDHGHHAAFRLDFFRRVGGYDEGFTHNEDAEFDCRQRALGARIYLDSEIRVAYQPRATLGSLWRQYFKYGAGRSRTVRRHPGSLRLRQLAVPAHLVLCVLALALSPISWLFLLWPAFYVSVLLAFSVQLAVRHRSLSGLSVARAALTMHTAWASGFFSGLVNHRERTWHREMTVPLPVGDGS